MFLSSLLDLRGRLVCHFPSCVDYMELSLKYLPENLTHFYMVIKVFSDGMSIIIMKLVWNIVDNLMIDNLRTAGRSKNHPILVLGTPGAGTETA